MHRCDRFWETELPWELSLKTRLDFQPGFSILGLQETSLFYILNA